MIRLQIFRLNEESIRTFLLMSLRVFAVIFTLLIWFCLRHRRYRFWWIGFKRTRSCHLFYNLLLVIEITHIRGQTSILSQSIRWMCTFWMTSSYLFIFDLKTFILLFLKIVCQMKPVACYCFWWLQFPLFLLYLLLSLQ